MATFLGWLSDIPTLLLMDKTDDSSLTVGLLLRLFTLGFVVLFPIAVGLHIYGRLKGEPRPARVLRSANDYLHGAAGVLAIIGLITTVAVLHVIFNPIVGSTFVAIFTTPILLFGLFVCAGIIFRAVNGGYPKTGAFEDDFGGNR